jgi:hypothetical protein
MISFIDEDPEEREERQERERQYPHILRLSDGELDVNKQLVAYAKERLQVGSARATAMEQVDLTSLKEKLEGA